MSSEDVDTVNTNVEVIDPMTKQLTNLTELLDVLQKTSKSLSLEFKILTKEVKKLQVSKTSKKPKRVVDPDTPRKLGALEKPIQVSEELCLFLNLDTSELHSRQKVTQAINKYVKDNDLQNPENRRYILLETTEAGRKLKTLLRDPDQPLTFFNIQRFLKPHYPPSEKDKSSESVNEPVKEPVKESVDDSSVVVEENEVPKKK
jgi:chromatin remodeling complex protein RSC6